MDLPARASCHAILAVGRVAGESRAAAIGNPVVILCSSNVNPEYTFNLLVS